MPKVLVVDDNTELAVLIHDFLLAENHAVDMVHDGQEAADRLKYYSYDVVILDWDLPKLSGVEVCKSYRASGGATPVIMLTGKKELEDKITGLDAGADDYLTKPFEMGELSARIRALLRRPAAATGNTLKVRELVLETDKMRLTRGDEEIYLVPKELALLEFLMRHPDHVFSSEALIARVWASDSEASPDTVRTYINKLRKKLDRPGEQSYLRTVHGLGYKLESKLTS
jgi:DNA-binding response OmpR family regulator